MSKSSKGVPNKIEMLGGIRSLGHMIPAQELFLAPKDHSIWSMLWQPRFELPVAEYLRDAIVEEGFRKDKPITVWQLVAEGGEVLLGGRRCKRGDALLAVGAGSRRSQAAYAAQSLLRKAGKLDPKEPFRIPVIYFTGNLEENIGDFFLMRQDEDSDGLKEPHEPSTVAWNFIQAQKYGRSVEAIMERAPRMIHGVSVKDATAMALLRWGALDKKTAALFDAGVYVDDGKGGDGKSHKVSINLLPTILDEVPESMRYKTLVAAAKAGIKHYQRLTRWIREQELAHEIKTQRKGRADAIDKVIKVDAVDEASAEASATVRSDPDDDEDDASTTTTTTDARANEKHERAPRGPREPKSAPEGEKRDVPVLTSAPPPKKRQALIAKLAALVRAVEAEIAVTLAAAVDGAARVGFQEKLDELERERDLLVCFAAGIALSLGAAAGDIERVDALPSKALAAFVEVFSGDVPQGTRGTGKRRAKITETATVQPSTEASVEEAS